jgi:hypothetical protein
MSMPPFGLPENLREAWEINPTDAEFPAYCTQCRSRWVIYRPPDCPAAELLRAATELHAEIHPRCPRPTVAVDPARPFGVGDGFELEAHDYSPTRS